MYLYLYDNFLRQKSFVGTMKAIETRLTDFGIAGKIIRLQHFTAARELIDEEVKRGISTVVIVGNDLTFGTVLSSAATCQTIFGFLPVGKEENSIASVLGIATGVDACDVLSKRRILKLDIGWFNNRYFISKLHIPPSPIIVEYDERFMVSPRHGKMELVVCNLQPYRWRQCGKSDIVVHPQDGKLEAFLRPLLSHGLWKEKYEDPSIFPFEEMTVFANKPFSVEADCRVSKEIKIKIHLAKNKIAMIVGKERKF